MKKIIIDSIKTGFITCSIILLTCRTDSLPWWSFVIPIIIFGIILSFLKWNVASFGIGFLSGFVVWFVTNLYFDRSYNSIFYKIGLLLSVPKGVVLVISGLIGGIITGLALYSGRHFRLSETEVSLEEKMNEKK